MKHLAIFDKDLVEAIFSGAKKVDGRFSKIRVVPFGRISKGDIVWMKISGGKIVGYFKVSKVISFEHLTTKDLQLIKDVWGKDLYLSEKFWREREKVNFATLIFIDSVGKFLVPPKFVKKDLRPWVVLE